MLKTAYSHGIQAALKNIGLTKHADDADVGTNQSVSNQPHGKNPAELLSALFEEADINKQKQSPDNKTKEDCIEVDGSNKRPSHWGPAVHGTGGEFLERNVPGFNLPGVSSI